MKIAISASDQQRRAILQKAIAPAIIMEWVESTMDLFLRKDAGAWIDCRYDGTPIPENARPLLIHSPITTLEELQMSFGVARFCAWAGFLERPLWDMAIRQGSGSTWLADLMEKMGWNYSLVADSPGLVAPRIVSMIINEAYIALSEGVSGKPEIDTAMKLGTNYPFGPFEWAERIGLEEIAALLRRLSETDQRYEPYAL